MPGDLPGSISGRSRRAAILSGLRIRAVDPPRRSRDRDRRRGARAAPVTGQQPNQPQPARSDPGGFFVCPFLSESCRAPALDPRLKPTGGRNKAESRAARGTIPRRSITNSTRDGLLCGEIASAAGRTRARAARTAPAAERKPAHRPRSSSSSPASSPSIDHQLDERRPLFVKSGYKHRQQQLEQLIDRGQQQLEQLIDRGQQQLEQRAGIRQQLAGIRGPGSASSRPGPGPIGSRPPASSSSASARRPRPPTPHCVS